MSMNDYGYLALTRMRNAELQAEASRSRLVRTARQAAGQRRAAGRGARRPRAVLHALRGLFVAEKPSQV